MHSVTGRQTDRQTMQDDANSRSCVEYDWLKTEYCVTQINRTRVKVVLKEYN